MPNGIAIGNHHHSWMCFHDNTTLRELDPEMTGAVHKTLKCDTCGRHFMILFPESEAELPSLMETYNPAWNRGDATRG